MCRQLQLKAKQQHHISARRRTPMGSTGAEIELTEVGIPILVTPNLGAQIQER